MQPLQSEWTWERLQILQNSSFTEASPSNSLFFYPGHLLGEFYPSAEMQWVYFTDPADWTSLGKSYPSEEMQSV